MGLASRIIQVKFQCKQQLQILNFVSDFRDVPIIQVSDYGGSTVDKPQLELSVNSFDFVVSDKYSIMAYIL